MAQSTPWIAKCLAIIPEIPILSGPICISCYTVTSEYHMIQYIFNETARLLLELEVTASGFVWQQPGAVQGVCGGSVQHRAAPLRPLHPSGLQRQAASHEPPHWWHSHLQGIHCPWVQGGVGFFFIFNLICVLLVHSSLFPAQSSLI